MASAKQIAANRRNALLSTGPVTGPGKAASSQNAVQHGLTGHTVVRRPEQNAAYAAFHASMLPDLAPSTTFERDLANRIVHDCWLLNQAGVMTENLLFHGGYTHRTAAYPSTDGWEEIYPVADALAFRADAATYNLLSLYRQRLERSFHKNLALLKSMQKDRTLPRPQSLQQNAAALKAALQRHADAVPAPPQPIDSVPPPSLTGFVSSTASANPDPPSLAASNDLENMAA